MSFFCIKNSTDELVIERSRFIAYGFAIASEDDAKAKIASLRKKHYDARHVCYAYVCGDSVKAEGDGEPQGTAGTPILAVLTRGGFDRSLIVVVRYFGGVKLGAGGLFRAYGNAAKLVASEKTECAEYYKYIMECEYADQKNILRNLSQALCIVGEIVYNEYVQVEVFSERDLQGDLSALSGVKKLQADGKVILPFAREK